MTTTAPMYPRSAEIGMEVSAMRLQVTHPETSTDGTAQRGVLITRSKAAPVQGSGALWKGVCIAVPLGLAFWLVIVWLLI